jgi:hypothetical protein
VDGGTIEVDFSPKGGPEDLKGVWEAAPIPGIRWPDGNLWSVKTADAIDFTGSYDDPNHPNCLREVRVVSGSNEADVSGTDGAPGCPPDGSGETWNLVGKVDGGTIEVDFSPKGGPEDLKGVWETAPVPGIRWPDGNLWSVKTATQ